MTDTIKNHSMVNKKSAVDVSKRERNLSVTVNEPELVGDHEFKKKHPTNYLESLIHFIKANSGSGIFAVSEAFKHAGIIAAPVLTVILGLFCLYGEHILLSSAEKLRNRKNLPYYPSFAETIEMGFANGPRSFRAVSKYMKPLVNFFIIVTHLGFCCVYFIFIASTSKHVLQMYGVDFNIRLHMLIFLLPVIGFTTIRSLKYLVPLSLIANCCFGFGIFATIYLVGFDLPPVSSRPYVGNLKDIPLFFGTVMYSFEGIGVVLPLKAEMGKPEKFDGPFGVLNVGMSIVITIVASFGFVGYLRFGDSIQSSITLNLDPNLTLSLFVKIAIAVGILFTYCLMFYVAMLVIWPTFNRRFGPFKRPLLAELLLRAFFVLITFVLSEGIPHLGLIISLIGAFSTTGLAVVMPPLCDISLRWPSDFGAFYWRFILDLITLILAFIGFSTGTFYSLKAIFEAFLES